MAAECVVVPVEASDVTMTADAAAAAAAVEAAEAHRLKMEVSYCSCACGLLVACLGLTGSHIDRPRTPNWPGNSSSNSNKKLRHPWPRNPRSLLQTATSQAWGTSQAWARKGGGGRRGRRSEPASGTSPHLRQPRYRVQLLRQLLMWLAWKAQCGAICRHLSLRQRPQPRIHPVTTWTALLWTRVRVVSHRGSWSPWCSSWCHWRVQTTSLLFASNKWKTPRHARRIGFQTNVRGAWRWPNVMRCDHGRLRFQKLSLLRCRQSSSLSAGRNACMGRIATMTQSGMKMMGSQSWTSVVACIRKPMEP